MENENANLNTPKQRHGCVTAWLILMIVVNAITALSYLIAGDSVSESFPGSVSNFTLIILALLGIANVIFAVLLFQWNKLGFWGVSFYKFSSIAYKFKYWYSHWSIFIRFIRYCYFIRGFTN
ncbi:hypothetical protein [Bizionia sp.]|uniref:hypothetical protein n=1 Tax=Bizionia sp. TaxID=1954480 RepID=UPI003A91E4F6